MTTHEHHINRLRRASLGIGAMLALLFSPFHLLAQGAGALDVTVVSNGGDNRSGDYGEMYSTVGEPVADDEIKVTDDKSTWTGFWQVVPLPAGAGVHEESGPATSDASGILGATPNPFRASIAIELGLRSPAHVRLVAYDMVGRPAALLVDGRREAGTLRLEWRPDGLQTGSYLLRLTVDGQDMPAQLVHYYR